MKVKTRTNSKNSEMSMNRPIIAVVTLALGASSIEMRIDRSVDEKSGTNCFRKRARLDALYDLQFLQECNEHARIEGRYPEGESWG
jgi:hypothetical protein